MKALGINGLPENERQTSMKVINDLGLSGKYAKGKANTWNINFLWEDSLPGKMILRVAVCGTSAREIKIDVNGQPAGAFQNLRIDGAPGKSGFTGMWYELKLEFEAALLKKGENVLSLTVPAGQADAAILYDYIRLEYQEATR